MTYGATVDSESRSAGRKDLSRRLEGAIRRILETEGVRQPVLTAAPPDIRVSPGGGFIRSARGTDHIVFIKIENHSPIKVFLSSLSMILNDGRRVVTKDLMTGRPLPKPELEVGESCTHRVEPYELLRVFDPDDLVEAILKDSIGREYRSAPGELARAFRQFAK